MKMQAGEVLHFIPYAGWPGSSQYFHCGQGRGKCTAAAQALIEKGLVGIAGEHWGRIYSLTDAGKSWKPNETEGPKNEAQ